MSIILKKVIKRKKKYILLNKIDDWDIKDKNVVQTRFLVRRTVNFRVVDMPLPLQAKVYILARRGMMKYYNENDVARYIKRNLMKITVVGSWQVIVGTNFAAAVSAEQSRYIYFWIGGVGFIAFKTSSCAL